MKFENIFNMLLQLSYDLLKITNYIYVQFDKDIIIFKTISL